MRPLSSTMSPHLEFTKGGDSSKKFRAVGSKIGWLHTLSDKPGANFDVTIKDSLGRVRLQKRCGTETVQFGELINFSTAIGEELECEISNLNVDNLKVFLN